MKTIILITGAAGFIGSNLTAFLLKQGITVVGIDNFDQYYSKSTKMQNIKSFLNNKNYKFLELDILKRKKLFSHLDNFEINVIVHLAANAGVRTSIKNSQKYQKTNLLGTQNLLDFAVKKNIKQFVFASSSSVYGQNKNLPWSENDYELKPISPYASSKVSAETLGYSYAHLFDIRFISLRFFTVYGPMLRPDLAIYKFTKSIMNEETINLFGNGTSERDYTFIDDVVDGIYKATQYTISKFEVFNIGTNKATTLKDLILKLETIIGKKALVNYNDFQQGDVEKTLANNTKALKLLNFNPKVNLEDGLGIFIKWYKSKINHYAN